MRLISPRRVQTAEFSVRDGDNTRYRMVVEPEAGDSRDPILGYRSSTLYEVAEHDSMGKRPESLWKTVSIKREVCRSHLIKESLD